MNIYHTFCACHLGIAQAILNFTTYIYDALDVFEGIMASLLELFFIKTHESFDDLALLPLVDETYNGCEEQLFDVLLDAPSTTDRYAVDEKHCASLAVAPYPLKPLGMNEYPCVTGHQPYGPQDLSVHVIDGSMIPRWKPGCTLYYVVVQDGLLPQEYDHLRKSMHSAVLSWEGKGMSINFKETFNFGQANFQVVYDKWLHCNLYATAFFPGDRQRVMRVGPRSFQGQYWGYLSHVLGHELGHVIGLRHDCWQPREPWAYDFVPGYSSVMNHKNASYPWLLVITDQDGQHARQFYQHPEGPIAGHYHIKDHSPITCTARECRC
ncbi:hypothetical protein BS50DRAFT_578002 [Corynespora cassiicola Philippines]|uniref:Peptidase metallopeptidase domain-containing protein n=1 Tax=Corynespora cassiicola Philippines TaxID=1448308 RepID=A0A2T2NAT1_CORCC|nr:hypothetical protein BS50DRAFT_578002 [Corynespora cassiicola Philippines]